MEAPARIHLSANAPSELIPLLSSAGIELIGADEASVATHKVVFTPGCGRAASRGFMVSVSAAGGPASTEQPNRRFAFEDLVSTASRILSSVLRNPATMLTSDPTMYAAMCAAVRAAPGRWPVLLEGETGTGKHLLYDLIRAASGPEERFIRIDCSTAETEEDAEACPFDPGSAWPAEWHAGARLTVFLDRIDELSARAQLRLGRSIEATLYGSSARDSAPGTVRYIATSRHCLPRMVLRRQFNGDLYRMLSGTTLVLIPLRDRNGDARLLAREFLRETNSARQLGRSGLRALTEYPFPGNVRELRNLITRLCIFAPSDGARLIEARDVRNQIMAAGFERGLDAVSNWRLCCREAQEEIISRARALSFGPPSGSLRSA